MSAAEYRRSMGMPVAGELAGAAKSAGKPAIRMPAPLKMTKVEVEYERILKIEFPNFYDVRFEAITLRLPGGSRYTPDFSVWHERALLLLVETKGAYRLSSAGRSHTAFKEAIAAFPHFKFRFAQKSKDGWKTMEAN